MSHGIVIDLLVRQDEAVRMARSQAVQENDVQY
jgi:hypothetical protein